MTIHSLLFIPADDGRKMAKALSLPVSAVCLDLEDAVAEKQKGDAREHLRGALKTLSGSGPLRTVRVNPVGSDHFEADIEVAVSGHVDAILLPMSETAADIEIAAATITQYEVGARTHSTGLIPVVETAKGVLDAREILTASERTRHVLFGPADFALSMGTKLGSDESQSLHGRQFVALAARAVGVDAIDGPFIFLDDDDAYRRSVEVGVVLGYSGKALIHPQQVQGCLDAFTVSPDDILWAQRVDAAFSEAEAAGVSSLRMDDGTFVDYAIVKQARQLLARASTNRPRG